VLTAGHRQHGPHIDIFWTDNEAGFPRLGVIVPKLRRTAVARNRLRRQLREIWRRETRTRLPAWDVVFRARSAGYDAPYQRLNDDVAAWCEERGR
jgi:ribonuclease P protein component